MFIGIKQKWVIDNVVEFVRKFKLEPEFRQITGYKGKLSNWFDECDKSDQEIIEELLVNLEGVFQLSYDERSQYFTIVEYDIIAVPIYYFPKGKKKIYDEDSIRQDFERQLKRIVGGV